MLRIIKFCFLLFIILIGLAFHLRNKQFIELDYYLGIIELPFSFLIVVSICIGAGIGVLATVPSLVRLKRDNTRLNRQITVSEQEINNLRVIPVKDSH